MSYVLKDKNGNTILRPINCPATDEQVKRQLEKILSNSSIGEEIEFTVDLTDAEKEELSKTIKSIDNAKNNSSCSLISFFTDVHLECGGSGPNNTRFDKHVYMYNQILKKFENKLTVFGGDYLQNSPQTVKSSALNGLSLLADGIKKMSQKAPIFVIKGNHDDNTMHTTYSNGWVNDEERWKICCGYDADSFCRNTDFLEKAYGYYDIPNQKIRVFMLNTVDIPSKIDDSTEGAEVMNWKGQWSTGYSKEQLQFVINNLHFSEEGWQVLFFSHHPLISNPFNASSDNGVNSLHGGNIMKNLLQAFINKTSGTGTINVTNCPELTYSVEYDFRKNKSNTIIACVCGHIHEDLYAEIDDINFISARAIDGKSTLGYNDTSCYFVVDRKNKKISIINNGDGTDSSYTYKQKIIETVEEEDTDPDYILPTMVSFSDGSENEIAAMLQAHYDGAIDVSSKWNIGDTRKFYINGNNYTFRIAAFNYDTLATPLGKRTKAAITLECATSIAQVYSCDQTTGYTNTDGWSNSNLRTECQNFFATMKTSIQNITKEVKRLYATSRSDATPIYVNDKMFLPNIYEILGEKTNSGALCPASAGTQYPYYENIDSNKRAKPVSVTPPSEPTNQGAEYWLANPSTTTWCAVSWQNSQLAFSSSSWKVGLSPAFCL